MDYKHTCDAIFTHFQGITNNIYGFGRPFFVLFFAPSLFYPSTTRPPYFYPSIFIFTCPNDGWTGLYIKLCMYTGIYTSMYTGKCTGLCTAMCNGLYPGTYTGKCTAMCYGLYTGMYTGKCTAMCYGLYTCPKMC